MPYQEPVIEVMMITQLADRVRTILRIISYGTPGRLSPPLIPGALVAHQSPEEGFFELHRLLARDDGATDQLIYETYGTPTLLPEVGTRYILRIWWGQNQLDTVRDRNAEWILQPYPWSEPGTHNHCLLTWETIAVDSDNPIAYHSHHGWLTIAAYEEFIVRDTRRLQQE
jgi:hypothetical protein